MNSPRFSLRQLSLAIVWISIGFGLVAFAVRPWEVPLNPQYDLLATLIPIVRVAAAVLGTIIVAFGLIFLLVKQRRLRTLIHTLCGALAGLFLAVFIAPTVNRSQSDQQGIRLAVFLFCILVCGTATPLLVNALKRPGAPRPPSNDPAKS
jgi:hypothetical protein